MNKNILITGGAGYIGSVFLPHLLDEGYNVTVLDNFMYRQSSLLAICHHKNLHIVVGDVRDEALLKNEVEKNDFIIPLAAIVGAPACNKDEQLAKDVNQTQPPQSLTHRLQQSSYPKVQNVQSVHNGQSDDE